MKNTIETIFKNGTIKHIKKYLTLSVLVVIWYFLVFKNTSESGFGAVFYTLFFTFIYISIANYFYLKINDPDNYRFQDNLREDEDENEFEWGDESDMGTPDVDNPGRNVDGTPM